MATITLTATVRDFRADHPDFENKRGPEESALVKPLLGTDHKPEYNGPDKGTKTTSGKANFKQWFNTTPGVNQEGKITIVLDSKDDPTGKLHRFETNAFFPIDGKLFGNIREELFKDGQLTEVGKRLRDKKNKNSSESDRFRLTRPEDYNPNHNYHFTLEAWAPFTYCGDEEFRFFGDDDLWVFIGNDQIGNHLVVDLGGVHAPVARNLDLRLNNPKNRSADPTRSLKLRLKEDLNISHAPANLELELVVGQTYDFRFFFAERHTFGSHFRIETSLPLKPEPPLPKVRIEATQPNAAEPTPTTPAVPGEFKISLMGGVLAPEGGLKVKYQLKDVGPIRTAKEGEDFTLQPAEKEVTIPAGQNFVLIAVNPLGVDSPDEAREEVVAELLYNDGKYDLGDRIQDTVYISNYVPPLATITAVRNAIEPRPGEAIALKHQALFTVSLSGLLTEPVTRVQYRITREAIDAPHADDTDFEPLTGSVEIVAPNRSADIVVTARADVAGDEIRENVVLELVADPQYYLVPALGAPGRAARVSITDPPVLPTVSIIPVRDAIEPRPGAAITEQNIGLFRVSINGKFPQDAIAIRYQVVGYSQFSPHAVQGSDYEPLSGSVTLSQANRTAEIRVVAKADIAGDEQPEAESVVLELLANETYDIPAPDAPGRLARIGIIDIPLPRVQIEATQPNAAEPTPMTPAVPGEFKISLLDGGLAPEGGLKVKYQLKDVGPTRTAKEGEDFTLQPAEKEVTIPAGQNFVLIAVNPLGVDSPDEEREEVVAELLSSDGIYILGERVQDTVYIANYVPPLATITAVRNAIEPRPGEAITPLHQALFTVSLNGPLPQPMTRVKYWITREPQQGPHADDTDFEPLSGVVEIVAPNRSAEIVVTARADIAGNEIPENVVLELVADPQNYLLPALGAPGRAARVSITDPPVLPTVSIVPIRDAVEPRPGEAIADPHIGLFRVTIYGDFPQDVISVRYQVVGYPQFAPHAIHGADYEALSGFVTLSKFNRTADILIVARADVPGDEQPQSESVVLELLPDPTYDIPAPNAPGRVARIGIVDIPLPPPPPPLPIASINAIDPWAREPQAKKQADRGRFIVTLEPKPATGMMVSYMINRAARKAAQPRDYVITPKPQGQVWIDPQTGQGVIFVTPNADRQADKGERVVAVLVDGPGYDLHPNPRRRADVVVILDALKPTPPDKPPLNDDDIVLPQPV